MLGIKLLGTPPPSQSPSSKCLASQPGKGEVLAASVATFVRPQSKRLPSENDMLVSVKAHLNPREPSPGRQFGGPNHDLSEAHLEPTADAVYIAKFVRVHACKSQQKALQWCCPSLTCFCLSGVHICNVQVKAGQCCCLKIFELTQRTTLQMRRNKGVPKYL